MNYFEPEATLRFSYTDAEGRMTARVVRVEHVDGDMITGRCLTKNARRTFRADRISNCWDEATHKYVPDALQHLRHVHLTTPRGSLDVLHSSRPEILQILLYVGKADGQLRDAEIKVIAAACKVLTGDVRITEVQVKELLSSMPIPSLHGFKIAVSKVVKSGEPATMRRIVLACKTIVNTQKTVTAAEQEALDYLSRRLTEMVEQQATLQPKE